jgi:hypothetical protein
MNSEIQNIWKQIVDSGLIDQKFFEDNISEKEFNELLEMDDAELIHLQGIGENHMSKYVEKLSFDDLLKLPFDEAKYAVDTFSMEKRIAILQELTERRTYYYSQTSRFGEGVPKDEQLSPEAFRSLLGKIKHLEIIQNWLYGIA